MPACTHVTGRVALVVMFVSTAASAQIDDRVSREGLERRAARRVFAVPTPADAPIEVYQVEEVRQQLPPHLYAVRVRNRSAAAVASYTIAAVVVGNDGSTRAIQRLPAVKNLKPGQARRQETAIRVAVLGVPDRVAFVAVEVTGANGQTWRARDEALRAWVKEGARLMPLRPMPR